ncbi:MAG: DUF3732 domain-containing protein [Caulobacteraceae bacterium]
MQIRRIVLYHERGFIRDLPFHLGKVNIVTGPSERGKSAILAIIDYCLGAHQLGVPAGVIQDSVAWYALELDFSGDRLFVARPGVDPSRKGSPFWHIAPGGFSEIPPLQDLQPRYKRDDLLDKISAKLGIGTTLIPRADGEVARKKLTFRSSLIYSLQKQNEIANPDLFFHRQGDPQIAQLIRDTLPYYLGAINEDVIAKQADLKARRKRIRELQKQLDRAALVEARRDDEAAYLVVEAQQCGLLPDRLPRPPSSDNVSQLLEQAESLSRSQIDAAGSDQLGLLAQQIAELDRRRGNLRRQIESLEDFGSDQNQVLGAVNEQRLRLRSLELASSHTVDGGTCPLCEADLISPPPKVSDLRRSLNVLDHELNFVALDRTQVQQALVECRTQLNQVISQIGAARARIAQLREEDIRVRGTLERRNTSARVGGMIQMFLRVASASSDEDRAALEMDIAALQATVEELEEETDFTSLKTKTATFLGNIGGVITRWAQELSLAYSSGLLTFDIRGPYLVNETEQGTVNFSRFGSGKNWVWYHLLGHMALHSWFIQRDRPTPRFLAIDQPSQVYFPGGETTVAETDLEEVRRIYDWLIAITHSFDGAFQVIITDHARFPDDQSFVSHVAHDWWETNDALVPSGWA